MSNDHAGASLEAVIRYHHQTQHHLNRYARSAGHMDWANQPNPFREYEGAPIERLPFIEDDPPGDHLTLYKGNRTTSQPFCRASAAGLLELSVALSAWKAYGGNRWALRINPSSGNLHPTEVHLVVPALADLSAGLYHYAPLHHALERRADLPESLVDRLSAHFGQPVILVGLTSIFWRESWKYGERAFRYCNHDVGHALAALRFAAALFGWEMTALTQLSDDAVAAVLGLDRTPWHPQEAEHPDLLLAVHTGPGPVPRGLPPEIVSAFSALPLAGTPAPLSPSRVDWEIIETAAHAGRTPETDNPPPVFPDRDLRPDTESPLSAARIIRQRRSAVAFTPAGRISREAFFAILDKTLPRRGIAPFDLELGPARTHLVIFVHGVDGLPPGLYLLDRTGGASEGLKAATNPGFLWEPMDEDLPLFFLQGGDFRETAIRVSCHQEIAGMSAFSLGMIAAFRETLAEGPHRYRHLFWETGMIGQILYLEAEAHGLRGTGIGCFFDSEVHALLGLRDDTWQSLYHFTVGRPVEDQRLTTLPAYHHLR
jgi:SagB-type dehydrogenase family enzyme